MIPALLLAGGATLVAVVVIGARWLDARAWQRSLVSLVLRLPGDLTTDQISIWLSSVAALTHAPRGALLPQPPVVVEVSATAAGIRHRLWIPKASLGALLASLRAALPGVRIEESPQHHDPPVRPQSLAAELKLIGRHRQLAVERGEATSRSLLAGMQPLSAGEEVRWQWIVTGAGTPPPIRTSDATGDDRALPWWLESDAPADADELRAARLKQRPPLLNVSGRLAIAAETRQRAAVLFGQAWGNVRLLNTPGARLVRSYWPSRVVAARLRHFWVPLLRWPLRLNAAELAGLLAMPVGETPLPGMPAAVARHVPPPVEMAVSGTVLADSTYPGMNRPLIISAADRRMHIALIGPTGTGKSTLMNAMALQDAARGDGLAVLDPKADLAADLLTRLPRFRRDDVIVVNPADTDRPVGFNPLATDGSEAARELAVDHVLHVLHEHWANFWGPRTDAVLRSGLLLLTSVRARDGSAFTICELPALLTNNRFRRYLMEQPDVPASVQDFMGWFESLSAAERVQVIGPVLNKLSALTQRTPVRLLLGQSQGVDLSAVLEQRKILVMPLSRGLIGSETAGLLSAIMLASLWQAALRRVRIPADKRRNFWFFIDEASEVVRLPLDMADLAAEARGLGVGLVMAAQHISQLPQPVRNAWLATVRSQVVFAVEPADARLLARSFAPTLSEADLRALGAFEVAMRVSINNQTSRPMTGRTRPLPPPTLDSKDIRRQSRERYGTPRSVVEEGLRTRLAQPAQASGEFGRRPRQPGGSS
jgi:energy-coupling factor transporter ATP-binding protein EcfA2